VFDVSLLEFQPFQLVHGLRIVMASRHHAINPLRLKD
jgi:hypothetical protein